MLFLQYAADDSAPKAPSRAPLDDGAAACLERAMLAGDDTTRLPELQSALTMDSNLASWALRTAENRLGHTVNRLDEAATWLSAHLATELAAVLVDDGAARTPDGVARRLPALVKKLSECERQLVEFETRLERDKLDAMKELAYGASHEINNPLANIAARADDPQ